MVRLELGDRTPEETGRSKQVPSLDPGQLVSKEFRQESLQIPEPGTSPAFLLNIRQKSSYFSEAKIRSGLEAKLT